MLRSIDSARSGLLALTVGVLCGLGCSGDEPPPVQPPPVPQLAAPRIAFSSSRTGTVGVHLYDPTNGQIVRISPAGALDQQAVISPDGMRIAFVDFRSSSPRIMTMAVDGNDRATCTNDPTVTDTRPHWSPDSRRLMFTRTKNATGEHDVFTAGVHGDSLVRVTADGKSKAFDWSPDGTKLLVARDSLYLPYPDAILNDMITVDVDGSNPHSLFGWLAWNMVGADYSPDGTRIIFSYERLPSSSPRLDISNSDGSDRHYLVESTNFSISGGIAPPSWSPDGSKIVFSAHTDLDTDDLYTIVPDGSEPAPLLGGAAYDLEPDWGPKP